jgi:hypothetical protein
MREQVLFLTGQSNPRSCALSPTQHTFLDALPLDEEAKVRLNFPYDAALAPYCPVPLALATARHALLAVRRLGRGFRERYRPAVLARLAGAEHTVVLAGSIGLDLLTRLELPDELLARTDVFAYGAVGGRAPACRTFRVAGRRDHLARWWAADAAVATGHLDYLESPEVLRLCVDFLGRT